MRWGNKAREIQVKLWKNEDRKMNHMNHMSKIVWFIKVRNRIAYLADNGELTDNLFDAKAYYTEAELFADFNEHCNVDDYEIANGSITRKYEICSGDSILPVKPNKDNSEKRLKQLNPNQKNMFERFADEAIQCGYEQGEEPFRCIDKSDMKAAANEFLESIGYKGVYELD